AVEVAEGAGALDSVVDAELVDDDVAGGKVPENEGDERDTQNHKHETCNTTDQEARADAESGVYQEPDEQHRNDEHGEIRENLVHTSPFVGLSLRAPASSHRALMTGQITRARRSALRVAPPRIAHWFRGVIHAKPVSAHYWLF